MNSTHHRGVLALLLAATSVAFVSVPQAASAVVPQPDYRTVSVTPDTLNESWAVDWWLPRHQAKLADPVRAGSQVVFIGDSITEGWEKSGASVWQRHYQQYQALNLGFGGDRTENILWRLVHGEVDGIHPKVAVLMMGTNNTGHREEDPRTTAAGIKRDIDELQKRLPDTRILLLAIFPRDEKPDSRLRGINERVNAIIAGFADNKKIYFLDINKEFLDGEGVLSRDIMPDLLHPNEKGYEIWAKAMDPALHALLSEDGYQWGTVAIGGSGFVSGLVTSKTERGLMYARTDVGGAYRRDAQSGRWIPLTDWISDSETGLLGVESIALDPSASNKLYMLAGTSYHNGGKTAILASDDYGRSFRKIDVTAQFKAHGNGMGRSTGEKLAVDPTDGKTLYVGTRASGMFKSSDAGLTWRHLDGLDVTTTANGNGISFVVPDAAAHRLFAGVSRYAAVGSNMYMSADGGRSFSALAGGPAGLMPGRAVIAGGDLVITYANGAGPWGRPGAEAMDQGEVWKYHIATGSWSNISPAMNAAYAGITVDPANPRHMLVTTIDHYEKAGARGDKIFSTTDGGASWHDVFEKGDTLDANGIDWIKTSFIHWMGSVEFDPFDSKTATFVTGHGIFRTADIDARPVAWKFDVLGVEESVPLNLVSIPGGPLISAIGDYDGFRHADVTRYAPILAPTMGTTTGLAYAAQHPGTVVRVGSAMYVSSDMGASWARTASLKGKLGQVALSADGKVIVHSPEKSSLSYYSSDAGASWSTVQGLAVKDARPVADQVNPKKMYALDGARLMLSSDAGASFAPAGTLPSEQGSKLIRTMPGREGDIWVALYDGGLARSTDSGAHFASIANVGYAAAVGFGKAPAGKDYPAVYLWGSVQGVRGLFCSADSGAHWLRINDDAHQYGGPGNGQFVMGDMNAYGVVYMSTVGRGIVYGKPLNGDGPCK